MLADIFLVMMFETSEFARMEQDKDNYYFRLAHTVRLVPMPMSSIFDHIFFLLPGKFFAKIIRQTINLRKFNL